MKKAILLLSVFAMSFTMFSSDVQLIVEHVKNNGIVAGNTYRVYAQLPSLEYSLHIVYGDQASPLTITSTEPFFQNQYSGYSAASVHNSVFAVDPTAKYDSWITVGYTDHDGNDMWDLGVDFTSFENGNNVQADNGGWFLLPTDQKCMQDANGLVLIAQLTTTGIATGTMNLQGWTSPQVAWRESGLTFSTTNALEFGCTDAKASNYDPAANFNNGTCTYPAGSEKPTTSFTGKVENESSWEVFPNPIRTNILNVQFKNVDIKQSPTRIDIIDMYGKLVGSHPISADAVLPGNRITLNQDLAAGSYQAVLIQRGMQESKTIIVEK